MLRRLQTIDGKNIDVQMKADVAMKRGMLVQKDYANGKAIMPTSQVNLFWVNKDVQPTGLMSYEGDISDYDTRLETIAVGDFVQLEKPLAGERYATDQFVSTSLVANCYVEVSTAADATLGKIIYKSSASPYKYVGAYTDNGTTLALIEVVKAE